MCIHNVFGKIVVHAQLYINNHLTKSDSRWVQNYKKI